MSLKKIAIVLNLMHTHNVIVELNQSKNGKNVEIQKWIFALDIDKMRIVVINFSDYDSKLCLLAAANNGNIFHAFIYFLNDKWNSKKIQNEAATIPMWIQWRKYTFMIFLTTKIYRGTLALLQSGYSTQTGYNFSNASFNVIQKIQYHQ